MTEAANELLKITHPEETPQSRIESFAKEMRAYLDEQQSWGKRLMDYERIQTVANDYKHALKRAKQDETQRHHAHMAFITALFSRDLLFLSFPEHGHVEQYSIIVTDVKDQGAWNEWMGTYEMHYYMALPDLREKVKDFYTRLREDLELSPNHQINTWLRAWRPEAVPQDAYLRNHQDAFNRATEEESAPTSGRLKYTLICFFGLIVGATVTLMTYQLLGLSKTLERPHEDGHITYKSVPSDKGWAYIAGGSVGIALAIMLLWAVKDRVSKACGNMGSCSMNTCLPSCATRENKRDRQERELHQLGL